ncbi:DUF4179 domain-containing protein [Lysinibacillus varians]|uniref:DUF4179 domain-containing protein n=1 Tax=Lysinibacillus varians TaxID=1145276 RepID=A0ABY2TA90_9BACI|nr:DUF4179 domain-containing protein [Lysinibacillus varians]AHN21042.1 cobalamin ABC transporter ATPase [Lysinibacillus varians]TKI63308.1 DUF4179 domain-containing protein [Lysinibacillus varians]
MKKPPIDVPKEQLQQIRMDVLRKVQREKRTKKRMASVAIVFLCCLSLLLSIRVSPTVASYVAKIPGLDAIVSAVVRDKGIKDIVEHKYYEEINKTQTKDGLSLTLQGVIADQSGFVLYYDADASFELNLEEVQLFQGDDEIKCGCSFTMGGGNQAFISSSVEYSFSEPMAYTSWDFTAVFRFKDKNQGEIEMTIPFSLQNEIAEEKVFIANRTVEVEGQKFTITKIRRTPLKLALDIEVDKANTMQILALDDIAVVTESGERRESIRSSHSMNGDIRDGKYTLYLQSNYFDNPQSLTVLIGAVQAVPKGEDFIEVDFGRQEVLSKPDFLDWDISVEQQSLKTAAKNWDGRIRHIFYRSGLKADGTTLAYKGGTFSDDDEYLYSTEYFDQYNGKAKIFFNYYYNPIGEDIEVKIPLQ